MPNPRKRPGGLLPIGQAGRRHRHGRGLPTLEKRAKHPTYLLCAWQWLLSTFENVSMFLKAPQVRLEQVKASLGRPTY